MQGPPWVYDEALVWVHQRACCRPTHPSSAGPGLAAGRNPCPFLLPLPGCLQGQGHLAEVAHRLSDSKRLMIWERGWRWGEGERRKEMENEAKKAKIQDREIGCRTDSNKGRRKERKKRLVGRNKKKSLNAICSHHLRLVLGTPRGKMDGCMTRQSHPPERGRRSPQLCPALPGFPRTPPCSGRLYLMNHIGSQAS